jgi:hypothetical protein
MTNLAYTKVDIAEEKKDMAPGGEMPKYPWGLSVSLDESTLTKLGKTVADFKIGDTITVPVTFEVNGMSSRKQWDGEVCSCVDLQITDIDMGPPPTTDAERADRIYNK